MMPLVLKVSVAGVLIFSGAAAEESWEMFGLESWKWELNCPTTPEERLSSHCGSNWELKSSMTTNKLARDKFFHFCDSLKDIYTECPKQSDIRDRWRYQNGWFFWETSKGEGHFEKNCNMIFRKWSVGGGSKVVLVASPVPNKKISWWGSGVLCCSLASPVIGQPATEHYNFHTMRKFYWSLFWETLYLSSQFLLSSIWHN